MVDPISLIITALGAGAIAATVETFHETSLHIPPSLVGLITATKDYQH